MFDSDKGKWKLRWFYGAVVLDWRAFQERTVT